MSLDLSFISKAGCYIIVFVLLGCMEQTMAQDSIFGLFRSDIDVADKHFEGENYHQALEVFQHIAQKNKQPDDIHVKIARCYYFLNQYTKAVDHFKRHLARNKELSAQDLYLYSEALASIGHYGDAIESYKMTLAADPSNTLVQKKLWRLSNVKFLYEDSIYFAIKKVPFNTTYSEFAARPFDDGVVFVSNREEVRLVHKIDAGLNSPFYKLYYAQLVKDSSNNVLSYTEPMLFDKGLDNGFHAGAVAFFDQGNKMVYTTTSTKKAAGKGRTLQLCFAEKTLKGWKKTASFPYNSLNYSNSDPAIDERGEVLYFTSDMNKEKTGKDIYKSIKINGQWTEPQNMQSINTSGDEVSPYLHGNNALYFASNGHPGLGGLDIFKALMKGDSVKEIQNLGYPLNSSYDDFGIALDSLGRGGFLTSNRDQGGYNDDVYSFEMDIQPYPLQVTGVVNYIEQNWVDSSKVKVLANAKLILIDNIENVIVAETVSDDEGNFSMTIPYYSKYRLQIKGGGIKEGIVSFEVPKHTKKNDKYEIVVVNDDFNHDAN